VGHAFFSGFLILLVSGTPRGDEALTVSIRPHVSFAPGGVLVRAIVAPDPENRAIEFSADSAEYFRSSTLPLVGERAEITLRFRFSGLPRGNYRITVRLMGSEDEVRASVEQRIVIVERESYERS
jgi:hypothetical protein